MAKVFNQNPVIIVEMDKDTGAIVTIVRESLVKDDVSDLINTDIVEDITADITGQELTDLQTGVDGVFDVIKTEFGIT